MNIKEAIAVLKNAGIEVSVKPVRLKRPVIERINDLLTLKHKVVVAHNGKRATVFTLDGYRGRVKGGKRGSAVRWEAAVKVGARSHVGHSRLIDKPLSVTP